MTRAEHVRWAKARALQELEYGGPEQALASLISDFGKHEETKSLAEMTFMLGRLHATSPDSMRRFIDGFAE